MSQFVSWVDYLLFARSVNTKYRYIRTPEEERFLQAVSWTAKERIITVEQGWEFWRAQRGYAMGTMDLTGRGILDVASSTIEAARPYPPERMKPNRDTAYEGRVNPKGIPCLYGARDPETAIAEVRPWKGELVSVGNFSVRRSLRIVECIKYHDEDRHAVFKNTPFYQVHPGERLYRQEKPPIEAVTKNVWTHIDQAFSEPITRSDDRADYAATQILAEVFRKDGYDGILYRSKLSDGGVNVAVFDPEVATVTTSDIHLYEVIDVKVAAKIHESRGIFSP